MCNVSSASQHMMLFRPQRCNFSNTSQTHETLQTQSVQILQYISKTETLQTQNVQPLQYISKHETLETQNVQFLHLKKRDFRPKVCNFSSTPQHAPGRPGANYRKKSGRGGIDVSVMCFSAPWHFGWAPVWLPLPSEPPTPKFFVSSRKRKFCVCSRFAPSP